MPDKQPMLLILGGTADALRIAAQAHNLSKGRFRVMSSQAGRVKTPKMPVGELRIGGFGGVEGLKAYMSANQVFAVIDATHPFAMGMSAHACCACDSLEIPRVQICRPEWPRHSDDQWIEVDTVADAAKRLPAVGRRAFLTVGVGELEAFRNLQDVWCLVRVVDEPAEPLLLGAHTTLAARGPFVEADELRLLQTYGVDVVVTKHAGGDATYGKLAAARALGIPVLMVRRPPAEAGDIALPNEALEWLQSKI